MTIKNEDLDVVKDNAILITVEGVVTIIHIEDEEDNGMEMTRITVTEAIRIEIPIVKVILTGVEDRIITVEVKDIVIAEEGDDGIPKSAVSGPRVPTGISISKPKSLPTTPDGTSIQIPNPIWSVSIRIATTTTIPILNANAFSTSR